MSVESFPELATNFDSAEIDGRLSWHVALKNNKSPKEVKTCADGHSGLLVRPCEKTDYWQRTYYEPTMIGANAHLLAMTVNCPPKLVLEASLTLDAVQQFDQAGVMVYVDDHHWLKAGMEYSDGQLYLGCVVTNEFSDWSTQDWPTNKLALRLYVLANDSCVVEAQASDGSWKMVRLCHLDMHAGETDGGVAGSVKVGLYTGAPTAEGGSAVFHSLSIKPTEGYHHHA